MRESWKVGLLAAGLLAAAMPVQADEASDKAEIQMLKSRLDRLEQRLEARDAAAPAVGSSDRAVVNLPSGFQGVNLSGFVDTTYTYNLNRPETNVNTLRVFDTRSDSFMINNAQLALEKPVSTESPVGFKTELMFGTDAEVVGGVTTGLSTTATANEVELQEAYAEYLAPIGNGLDLKAGKFATLHGAEVIESKDNWNISRSFLFGYAIPFTHTGVRAAYPVSDMLTVLGGVSNGWDVVDDNNTAKTVEFGFSSAPVDGVTLGSTFMMGPEQTGNNGHQRSIVDVVAGWQPTDALQLKLNYDYGWENDAVAFRNNAVWHGLAGYARYAVTDKAAVSLRTEYMNDADGVRTAFNTTGLNGLVDNHVRLYEVTLTGEYQLNPHLTSRLEYRHDKSDASVFRAHSTDNVSYQDTVAMEFIAPF